jgi:hypothetical protein
MSANFGKYEGPTFRPSYGDIDWRHRQDLLIEQGELDPVKRVGFDSEDGLVVEITQENTQIRLNRVAPHMDMLSLEDYRDSESYIWFRETHPERFAVLVEKLGRSALVIETEFPLEDTVKVYLNRAFTGNDPSFLGEAE